MRISRRDVLRGMVAFPMVAALPLGGCTDDGGEVHVIFVHGVASGDPLPDALIIWTRVSTATGPTEVLWEVSADDFATIAKSGSFTTDESRDYTVKVDVTGLTAGTAYRYRFTALGETSTVGRARTPPAGAMDAARFAVVSCSSYAHGYFHAYRAVAGEELDAVIHLGDYIYEYGDGEYGDVRTYQPPHEIISLADYRTRYGYYRKDPDLQAVHRQHPFIAVWDDHESANNAWAEGAENHTTGIEGSWADRKAAAARAYAEWMPIRENDGPQKIHRAHAERDDSPFPGLVRQHRQ